MLLTQLFRRSEEKACPPRLVVVLVPPLLTVLNPTSAIYVLLGRQIIRKKIIRHTEVIA